MADILEEVLGVKGADLCCDCDGFINEEVATVCLPVKVIPYAQAGPAKIECEKKAKIDLECKRCKGKPDGSCEFSIIQKLRLKMPVKFGASVEVGNVFVDCKCDKPHSPCREGDK